MEFLRPDHITFACHEDGGLCLEMADGTRHESVYCAPLFPISDPHAFIAVMMRRERAKDESIGVIAAVSDLRRDQRRLVLEDLKLAHFLPEIKEVRSVRRTSAGHEWQAVTDHGERTFTVKNPRENTAVTAEGVTIVTDQHRMRYRITNIQELDRKSQIELQKAEI